MNAVPQAGEPSARYLADVQPSLVRQFDLLATAPGGVARLRELIFALAVQGKLVRQDPSDEPATDLLVRIRAEKARLTSFARSRAAKSPTADDDVESPVALPVGWAWSTLVGVGLINPRNEAEDDVVASFVQMSSIPAAYAEAHIAEPRAWREIKSGFTQFAEGDVGVAKITPCFENGKSTVFRNLSSSIGAGTTELHIVRPLCGIEPRYILVFLKSPGFLREGEAVMTGTAGQKRLPRPYFESKPFPLPPLAEQARIVARVDELMRLCDALEAKGRLEAAQHAQLLSTLLGTLTDSASPESHVSPPPAGSRSATRRGQATLGSGPASDLMPANWQRFAAHFDLLLDRPEAVDALEQTILQLAVRGLLVPQDPNDEPASVLLERIRAEKQRLIAAGKFRSDKPASVISDDDLLFELRPGWQWTKLPYLASVAGGATPSKAVASNWVGDIPWVSPKDMKVSTIADAQDHIAPSALAGSLNLIPPGSLLMVVRGMILAHSFPVARTAVAVTINQDMKALTPVEPRLLPFLQLLCEGLKPEILRLVDRSTHGTCKLESPKIFGLAIPIPPLAEQSRIVARVEELRRLCAALRRRLAARQSTLSHLADALVDEVT